jgi:Pyridoxamine 5'-phosphate oxidase
MASWNDVVAAKPEFADHVRRTFAVRKHATLATLRRDGSPRISGTEV